MNARTLCDILREERDSWEGFVPRNVSEHDLTFLAPIYDALNYAVSSGREHVGFCASFATRGDVRRFVADQVSLVRDLPVTVGHYWQIMRPSATDRANNWLDRCDMVAS